jgi:hypothetical protein
LGGLLWGQKCWTGWPLYCRRFSRLLIAQRRLNYHNSRYCFYIKAHWSFKKPTHKEWIITNFPQNRSFEG